MKDSKAKENKLPERVYLGLNKKNKVTIPHKYNGWIYRGYEFDIKDKRWIIILEKPDKLTQYRDACIVKIKIIEDFYLEEQKEARENKDLLKAERYEKVLFALNKTIQILKDQHKKLK